MGDWRATQKDALNVDESRVWTACSNEPVFVGNAPRGDGSLPPDVTVLPGVIEQSERSIIAHGDKDFILISQGSALAIQNMTWNGLQGFQERPTAELKVDGQALGTVHTERGLTFATVAESGRGWTFRVEYCFREILKLMMWPNRHASGGQPCSGVQAHAVFAWSDRQS